MRYLVAFDKFKDALDAEEACDLARYALAPFAEVVTCPLTDGGDGFSRILTQALVGMVAEHRVTGPLGLPRLASWGLVACARLPPAARTILGLVSDEGDRSVALLDVASTSGLNQVPPAQRDPRRTTSAGLGDLILAAAAADPAAIIIGLGGSATNDLGLGALSRLGLHCGGSEGGRLDPPYPGDWAAITQLVGELPATLPPLILACDVTHTLLGPQGATAVFGPQKGLPQDAIEPLDQAMGAMACRLARHFGVALDTVLAPGSGAAGGIAAGMLATRRARLVPGFGLVAACLDLARLVADCDCVVTGEGRFDSTSLQGKATGALLRLARAMGKPVKVIAGSAEPSERLAEFTVQTLSSPGEPLALALPATRSRLTAALQRLGAAPCG